MLKIRELGEPWCSLPLVTLGLALVWLLSAAVIEIGYSGKLSEADQALRTAANFGLQHPEVQVSPRVLPVARALMPTFDSNSAFDFLRRKASEPGGTQDQFDDLSATAFTLADAHPYRAVGLVPAALRPASFLTHPFVHSGLRHAATSILLLLLAGPVLERLWGRRVFGGALLGWGLLSGGLYFIAHLSSDHALLGGSALVSACVAALVARLATDELDFLDWLGSFADVQLAAPGWALAPVWVLAIGCAAWGIPGAFAGVDNAMGWTALAAGAASGAGFALLVRKLGWEERFGMPARSLHETRARETFDLAKVKALHASGECDAALTALERQVERSPGHRDAVMQWFLWAVEELEPERAAPAMRALMGHELRRGADEMALAQWRELSEHVEAPDVEAATLQRLTLVAQREGQDETLLMLLQALVDAAPPGAVLADAARTAADLSPELALFAAQRALSDTELSAGEQTEMQALVDRFAVGEPGEPMLDRESKPKQESAPPPNVFYEESDRSDFGEIDDLANLENFPDGAVSEAVPLALIDGALRAELDGRGALDVSFSRLRAVAMAGVQGLGPRPVVLIDLLLDGSGSERQLSVLRLRSDRFDPRKLLGGAGQEPLAALRGFVAALLQGSGGIGLPTAETHLRPVQVYPSLAAYHEAVLQPAALELG